MSGSLRYETVESCSSIVKQLYLNDQEETFFTCEIKVPLPRADSVEDGTLKLDLKRMYDLGPSYEAANEDRTYRTKARFTGDIWEFDVDVTSYTRLADLVGATISMDGIALEIFKKIQER